MHSDLSVGFLESFTILCACVHMFDVSIWLASHSGLLTRSSTSVAGRSRVADIFAGLFELPASLFMRAHVSNTSISSLGLSGSPMHGFALLTGKSGVTNTFIAPLELFASPCFCLRTFGVFTWVSSLSDSSVCRVALPVDESAVLGLGKSTGRGVCGYGYGSPHCAPAH